MLAEALLGVPAALSVGAVLLMPWLTALGEGCRAGCRVGLRVFRAGR